MPSLHMPSDTPRLARFACLPCTLALAAACTLATPAAHAQCTDVNIPINGSFETPVIANNSFQQVNMAPWVRFEGAFTTDIFVFRGTVGSIWPIAHTGAQFADVGNTQSLSCFFTVPYPALVTVSWYDNAASGALWSAYDVFVNNRQDPFGAFGAGLVREFLNAANGGPWQQETLTGALGSGLHNLSFAARGVPTGFDTLLDTVTITINPQPFAFLNPLGQAPVTLFVGNPYTLSNIFYRIGGQNITRQWQIETTSATWIPLTDGPIAGFGSVTNTATDTPTFTPSVFGASIRIRPFISNSCGAVDGLPLTINISQCDSIDFNNDGLFPDDNDLIDFLAVLAGGPCTNDPSCNDIDFNNDGLFPDDNDLISFLNVLAGGPCNP